MANATPLSMEESIQIGVLYSMLQSAGISSNDDLVRVASNAQPDDPPNIAQGRELLELCPEQRALFLRVVEPLRLQAERKAKAIHDAQAAELRQRHEAANEELDLARELIGVMIQRRWVKIKDLVVHRNANPVLNVPNAAWHREDVDSLWPAPGQPRTALGLCARAEFAEHCLGELLDAIPLRDALPREALVTELQRVVHSPEVPLRFVNRIVREYPEVGLTNHPGYLTSLLARIRVSRTRAKKFHSLESVVLQMLEQCTQASPLVQAMLE